MLQKLPVYMLFIFLLTACRSVSPSVDRGLPESISHGTISLSPPEIVDPNGKYLFYLHGKIIEDQGVDAVSSQFGPYEFEEILRYLADAGFNVIGEVRAAQTDVDAYSDRVVSQVDSLRVKGVPDKNVTIIGYSKGAAIAILTSTKLKNPDLNFVLIAICGDWINDDPGVALAGRIFSLYERSDDFGTSCVPLVERSPEVTDFDEIEFNTGKQHGAFYTADPIWLDPIISWIGEGDP